MKSGNLIAASHSSANVFGFKILRGGKLSLNNCSLISTMLHGNSRVFVDSSAIVSLTNESGLSGNPQSAFGAAIDYSLNSASIIEYRGDNSQSVTGLSSLVNQSEKKYGILRIIMADPKYAAILEDKVYVRTRLELIEGKIKLNSHTLTLENGNPAAISRVNGFIESEFESPATGSSFCWKNMSQGIHEFPFGRTSSIYLPVIFNVQTGTGYDASITTCRTYKSNSSGTSNTSNYLAEALIKETKAVDRWWSVLSPGIKADIMFTYSTDEISVNQEKANDSLCALQWSGSSWLKVFSSSTGGNNNTRTITLKNIINGSEFVIIKNENIQKFELKLFEVKKNKNEVLLSWESLNEVESPDYIIEKSFDGINFFEIGKSENNITSDNLSSYNFSDKELPTSISYYRLKYSNNSKTSYSQMKIVRVTDDYKGGLVKINSVSPNPFYSVIKIEFSSTDERTMIEVVDSDGRRILNIPTESSGMKNGYTQLNLEYLKKGVYFLNIISNGKKDTKKIIKND